MFKGQRLEQGVIVYHNKQILSSEESQKLINHSPDGFNWGYVGSGSAQLSLAVLLAHTKDRNYSLRNYQKFLDDIISKLKSKDWKISDKKIEDWMKKVKSPGE